MSLLVYGAGCVWWDSIDKAVASKGSVVVDIASGKRTQTGLPVCPKCGSVLYQIEEATWWANVEQYAKVHAEPGYVELVKWSQGRCFKNYDELEAAFESREVSDG